MASDVNDLLEWLANDFRIEPWAWIVAMDRNRINEVLRETYVERFSNNAYLPPVSGVAYTEQQIASCYLQEVVLDWPRLSFDNTDMDNSTARLKMRAISGRRHALERDGNAVRVRQIEGVDPLKGPELSLDLPLSKVPGLVRGDGSFALDLNDADAFTFNLRGEEDEPAGEVFKKIFKEWCPQYREFPIGFIDPDQEGALKPHSFLLRTQVDPDASGEGALLVFISADPDSKPASLENLSDFKYLIPSGPQNYTATVLVSWRHMIVQMLLDKLVVPGRPAPRAVFKSDDKVEIYAEDYVIALLPFTSSAIIQGESLSFSISAVALKYSNGLSVEFHEGVANISGILSGKVTQTLVQGSSSPQVIESECLFGVRMACKIVSGEVEPLFMVDDLQVELYPEEDSLSGERFASHPIWVLAFMMGCVAAWAKQSILLVRVQVALYGSLALSVQQQARKLVKLNFEQLLGVDKVHAPKDVAAFGRFDSAVSPPSMVPDWPTISVGEEMPFTMGASSSKIVRALWARQTEHVWEVEALDGGPASGKIGTDGVYHAPAQILTPFLRERVKGYSSSGMAQTIVTVVKDALLVGPEVTVCGVNDKVPLSAFTTGHAAGLSWVVKAGGRGTISPGSGEDVIYTAPKMTVPKHYEIETVEVDNGKQTRAVKLIVRMLDGAPLVRILRSDPQQSEVHFVVELSQGSEYKEYDFELTILEDGPGQVIQSGGRPYYKADNNSAARFVLLDMKMQDEEGDWYNNFYILPLPVGDFGPLYAELQRQLPPV
ncbi:hypothetical protein [Pseudomonas sichuanensis]|uniref:Uncharacterized protein n=1 Tax=Pseudomonas sichuanensis TaxID=2213015 RepID=A0ABV0DBQ6_9PSED